MNTLENILQMLYKQLNNLYDNNIPKCILERIEFFKQLDNEHKDNATKEVGTLFSPKNTNKSWRGFWLKATGMDEYLYVSYLVHIKKKSLLGVNIKSIDIFRRSHPNEKYIPYSVEIVDQDM